MKSGFIKHRLATSSGFSGCVTQELVTASVREVITAANQAVMMGRNLPRAKSSDWPQFNEALSDKRSINGKP